MDNKNISINTSELKKLIKEANQEALDDMYAAIGRGMVTKFLYLIGSSLMGLAFAMAKKYANIKGIE